MKSRSLLASFATLITLTAAPATAADMGMPVKAPPPAAAPVYNWTGFYIGAHVGGAWGDKDWTSTATFGGPVLPVGTPIGSHDASGMIAGGQLGFNWQAPGSNWVIGVEAQMSWADLSGDHILGPGPVFAEQVLSTKVDWLGTVTGRLGYAWDRALLYAKGGVAFVHDKHHGFLVGAPNIALDGDTTRTGWTIGGGIELALGGNWSVKGEYNYLNFGKDGVDFTDTGGGAFSIDIDQHLHVVKFGINYRFGGFGPVVARY
jgi:outer membrane immunogenic protein